MKRLLRLVLSIYFEFLEKCIFSSAAEPAYPPIFIVGAPRAGTTLTYQILVKCFNVSYICNRAASFYGTPAAASFFFKNKIHHESIKLTSDYGAIEGAYQPNQAVRFWKQWFPEDGRAVDETYLSVDDCRQIRKQIAAIESVFAAPFVHKQQENSTRMRALSKVFPNCLFIWTRRDPTDMAFSLYQKRKGLEDSENMWWSVKPREFESIKTGSLIEQVCAQVVFTEKNIAEDAAVIGSSRVYVLKYDELCADPARQLDNIKHFVEKNRGKLDKRYAPPDKFNFITRKDEKGAEAESLRKEIRRIQLLIP